MSIFNDAKKEIKKVANAGSDACNKVKNETNGCVNKVKRETTNCTNKIKKESNSCLNTIKKEQQELESLVSNYKNELKKVATENVQEVIQGLADALSASLTTTGLSLILNVLEGTYEGLQEVPEPLVLSLNSISTTMELGPVTLHFSNFYSRAEEIIGKLREYTKTPPKLNRTDIITFVKALGPTSIDVDANVSIQFVVAGTNILKVGAAIDEVPMELVEYILDRVLAKIGVSK